MKFSILRAFAALLALCAMLSACGGKATYDVSGTFINSVTGLAQPLANGNMVLTNNGGDPITIPAGASTFTFPHRLSYGETYNVAIKTNPDHMTCGFQVAYLAYGTAGHTTSISIPIICVQATHLLGGTVQGLSSCPATDSTTPCVTLTNGSDGTIQVTKPADGSNNAPFNFATQVKDGDSYGVAVLSTIAGYTCTVTNGSGVMHTSDVGNVVVNCTKQ